MVWLHFGEMREVSVRGGGTNTVGDWAIHVQCPWRISRSGRIVIAYHDFYCSPDGVTLHDWHVFGKSRFDSTAIALSAEIGTTPPIVASVQSDDVGGFSVRLSGNYRLDVFPDDSAETSEHWRVFQPGVGTPHFVFHETRMA